MKRTSFPDVPRALQYMKIHDQLQLVSDRTLFGIAIGRSLIEKDPLSQILAMIVHEYGQAPAETTEIVGEETMKLILTVYGNNTIHPKA